LTADLLFDLRKFETHGWPPVAASAGVEPTLIFAFASLISQVRGGASASTDTSGSFWTHACAARIFVAPLRSRKRNEPTMRSSAACESRSLLAAVGMSITVAVARSSYVHES